MTVSEIIGALLIGLGVAIMVVVTFNIFRLDYVINRMHLTAMGDSLATLLIFLGAAVAEGLEAVDLKLILIITLQWITSPVCGHMITQLEYAVVDDLSAHTVSIKTEREGEESY